MPEPKPPQAIDSHARAVLDGLATHPEAAVLVLGGAFALRHYLDYRDTHDLDAMTALVSRGAPRDMLDVYMAYREHLATVDALWELWRARNSGQDEHQARTQILHHLAALEARRPLVQVPTTGQEQAREVRVWLRDRLAASNL